MTYEKQEELKKVLVRLIPRARNDREFRKKLLSDPLNTIIEQGIHIPEEVKITVLQDTKDAIYLVLPLDRPDADKRNFIFSHTSKDSETKYHQPETNLPFSSTSDTKQNTQVPLQSGSIFTLTERIEPALDEVLKQIDSIQDITQHILPICDNIQEICDLDEDAVISWIMLDQLFIQGSTLYNYTLKHSVHCAIISELAAKRGNIPIKERKNIIAAALTMNISILGTLRTPHKTDQEDKFYDDFEDLKKAQKAGIKIHPTAGAMLLEKKGVKSSLWLNIVIAHHEKPDGTGYPKGLIGAEIIKEALIVSLADLFAQKVSAYNYKSGLKPEQTLNEIFSDYSRQFGKTIGKDLAMPFIKVIGTYPPGTLVKLANNETAIVARKGETPDTPIVFSIIDPLNQPLPDPIKRDCSSKEYSIVKMVNYSEVNIPINRDIIWL